MKTKLTASRKPKRTASRNTRWLIVDDERWEKMKAYTERLENEGGQYGFKLTVNRVASMLLADAIDRLAS
jgi:hypothetical protein